MEFLITAKKLSEFIKTLEGANSVIILLILDKLGRASSFAIYRELAKEGIAYLSTSSIKTRLDDLISQGMVTFDELEGRRAKRVYYLTKKGQRFVKVIKKFLRDLENEFKMG